MTVGWYSPPCPYLQGEEQFRSLQTLYCHVQTQKTSCVLLLSVPPQLCFPPSSPSSFPSPPPPPPSPPRAAVGRKDQAESEFAGTPRVRWSASSSACSFDEECWLLDDLARMVPSFVLANCWLIVSAVTFASAEAQLRLVLVLHQDHLTRKNFVVTRNQHLLLAFE